MEARGNGEEDATESGWFQSDQGLLEKGVAGGGISRSERTLCAHIGGGMWILNHRHLFWGASDSDGLGCFGFCSSVLFFYILVIATPLILPN